MFYFLKKDPSLKTLHTMIEMVRNDHGGYRGSGLLSENINWFLHSPNVVTVSYQISSPLESETLLTPPDRCLMYRGGLLEQMVTVAVWPQTRDINGQRWTRVTTSRELSGIDSPSECCLYRLIK